MNKNKKAVVAGIIIAFVFFIVMLLMYVLFMPLASPYIADITSNSDYGAFTKFLFAIVPVATIIAIVVGGLTR